MKIVFLDSDTFPKAVQVSRPNVEHSWVDYPSTSPDQTAERIKDADIVLSNKVVLDRSILESASKLKHIAVAATGYNNIDVLAAQEFGISVSNVTNYAQTTVPEQVIAYLFALRRELIQYRSRVIEGAWQKSSMFCLFDKPINDLANSTLGIIGFGDLGQATARLALNIGINVKVCSTRSKAVNRELESQIEYMELDELLASCDAISVHCVLNEHTKDLINQENIGLMPKGSILINTARGGIVNEQAVADAILNEHLGAIGFDVLTQEPPINPSPLLDIADRNNVIITPHIAWASNSAMQTLMDKAIDNIEAFAKGKPQSLVT